MGDSRQTIAHLPKTAFRLGESGEWHAVGETTIELGSFSGDSMQWVNPSANDVLLRSLARAQSRHEACDDHHIRSVWLKTLRAADPA